MSNVLIGIIGVILFIGLALAGALILGDDFKSSRAETKAAETTATLQQMVNAVNMYEMKTGRQLMEGDDSLLVGRFLKMLPLNPISPTYTTREFTPHLAEDAKNSNADPAKQAKYIVARVITATSTLEACRVMNGQAPGETIPVAEVGQIGCKSIGISHYIYAKL